MAGPSQTTSLSLREIETLRSAAISLATTDWEARMERQALSGPALGPDEQGVLQASQILKRHKTSFEGSPEALRGAEAIHFIVGALSQGILDPADPQSAKILQENAVSATSGLTKLVVPLLAR